MKQQSQKLKADNSARLKHPCFIRHNSKELRDKLKELGYKICPCCTFEGAEWLTTYPLTNSVHGVGFANKEKNPNEDSPFETQQIEFNSFISDDMYIDCNNNEAAFLALAALNKEE